MQLVFRNWRFIGMLLVLAGIALLIWLPSRPAPRTYTVTRTQGGFEPATLTINQGDTVTFVSTAGNDFWPASDFHPSHLLYPAFDPKQPIKASASWSFVFDRAGVWTYHDHLYPQVHGTINVAGAPQADLAGCATSPNAGADCWAGYFTTLVRDRGLTAAFDAFAKLYADNPNFQRSCHDIAHVLGKAGYDDFKKNDTIVIRPETSYCAYGFYHGFIEEMFTQNGSLKLEDGTRYCEEVRANKSFPSDTAAYIATTACFHGLGHASFDSLDQRYWGDANRMVDQAISACESAAPEEYKAPCASGVFNSLAIAESAEGYGLSFNTGDPTAVCRSQKEAYQRSCYEELSVGFIRQEGYDFTHAMQFIHSLSAHVADTIYGYVDDYSRFEMATASPADLKPLCDGLANIEETDACVYSIVHGLVSRGEPGKEEVKALQFCALFPEKSSSREYCFGKMAGELSAATSYDHVDQICATLSESDATACKKAEARH